MRLRDYQEDALADLEKRFGQGATRVPQVLATGLGKGSPVDTPVPTPDGWRRWGDLKTGDRIFGRSGDPVQVTAIFDRGTLPAYRVTFSDESSIDVDGDHLWTVRDSAPGQGTYGRRTWVTVSTAELAGHELKLSRGWRFHIPMADAARYDAHPSLPLDPYTVGALISNGSLVGYACQLTTPDRAVIARIEGAGIAITPIKDATPGVCPRYHLPGIHGITRDLGMRVHSKEKRIPATYLVAEVPHRIALLQGLMDGDGGNRDATRRSVSYFTSSQGLANDVRELVNSLGGTGIVKRYDRGEKGIEYTVRILLPSSVEPFSTLRKGADHGTRTVRNLQPKRAIVSIEPIGDREIRCITVNAPDHLYLIGHSYTVTHNTQIFTSYADRWLAANAGRRVLIIAHTDELIMQAAKRARLVAPGRRVGIVKAGQNETLAEIIVSSRQTLASAKRREQLRNVGLIVIDECHHATRHNTYGKILEHFGAFDDPSPVQVVGYTATLVRSDKAKLSSVWESCTFTRDILFGIRNGYLLDVRGERVVVPDFDMSNVRVRAGDYSDSDIADELERTFAPEVIAAEYARLAVTSGGVPRKGIAFWPLVATAYHGADAFNDAGIPSAVVHGAMPKEERRLTLKRFAAGDIQVVHNAMVLTEGFDEPTADVVVIARPTRAAGLYQQMVGRVLRPDLTIPPAQREKALILDVTGAGEQHDLRSLIDLAPERALKKRPEDDELSLLELDEFQLEIEEELQQQRAGGSFEFECPAYDGATTTKAFDPLGRDKVWGRTAAGHWFIKAGAVGFVFLVPSDAVRPDDEETEPNTFDVVTCSVDDRPTRYNGMTMPWARATEHRGLPLDMALSWGEDVAVALGGVGTKTLTGRTSAWRKKPPSEGLKRLAGVYRISLYHPAPMTPGGQDHTAPELARTMGELSELINAAQANRRIDPLVTAVTGGQGAGGGR